MTLSADDKLEIQELAVRYANAMDAGDDQAWLATWEDDGVWEGGLGRYEGKAGLTKLLADLGARVQGKRHLMTNFVIEGDTTTASQTCYMVVADRVNEARIIATGVYTDKLKKTAGRWRFASRTVKLDPSFRPSV